MRDRYEWIRSGRMTSEEIRAAEDIVLRSGNKALAMAYGRTPEWWGEQKRKIMEKRKDPK